jgi:hypothetical protein
MSVSREWYWTPIRLFLVWLWWLLPASGLAEDPQTPPNFIVIMADENNDSAPLGARIWPDLRYFAMFFEFRAGL